MTAASGERSTSRDGGPINVIIDTDIGTDVDDAIALAFALRRPELRVCGVTTTRFMPHTRARIVARLLKVLGRTDVPYAPGATRLFNGDPQDDKPVNQAAFADGDADLPPPACDDAQELYRRIIEANRGRVWLVTLGPMTNVACLLRDQPELAAGPQGIRGVAAMAGEPMQPRRETNILRDPHAAAAVFRSGALRFVGTWAVTRQVAMTDDDLARLRAARTPLSDALAELIALWEAGLHRTHPRLCDMSPIAWLFAPERFETRAMSLAVDLEPPERLAMVREVTGPDGESIDPTMQVTTALDEAALRRMLMDTLLA